MNRRNILMLLLGSAGFNCPIARAQHRKTWLVGFLALPARPDRLEASRFGAFVRGMREEGYVEGGNLKIEWRFAGGDVAQLPRLAAELIALNPDIIVGGSTPVIHAAQMATNTIPIVMAPTNDPVGSGLVNSLSQPGGNITGLSNLSTDLSAKTIELLQLIAPMALRVAVLSNPENSSNVAVLDNLRAAMERVGVTAIVVEASSAQSIDTAFAKMGEKGAQAVVVAPDTIFVEQRRQIAELALKHRLSSICEFREHVEAGALMSYGQNLADGYRRTATFVDKILKGAKPADLPIEQSTKLELVINFKTAKVLGLTVPPSLLARADEVIE
jgi:putative tryptophan/tyrosine transport system substrate-binding protein